ncbi:MAG: DUF1749 domain-containing protein [Chitinophagales bacterium]
MLQLPLQYGPYNVGFRYHCIFDEGRFYQTSFPDNQTTLRPVPLNVWYPTQKTAAKPNMRYQNYWDFESKESALISFHERMKHHHIEKARLYFSGKEDKDWTEVDEKRFQQLMQSQIMATKNAPVLEEAFPMIIYHQGLDAHIDDNALMLEYLASWGYVVVSSSFHPMDAKTLGIDWDLERSIADIEIIIQYKKRKFHIKENEIALIGHSFGAQVVLGFMGEKYANYRNSLKAAILQDTTIDYDFYTSNPKILEILSSKQDQFQTPILAFARLSSTFTWLNTLQYARRYYCKVGHVSHNDFVSIGAIAASLQSKNKHDNSAIVWQNYQQTCVLTLCFLDAFVKQIPQSQKLFEENAFEKMSADGLQCEQLQPGRTQRHFTPYQIGNSKAPTFEQLIELINREGIDVFYQLYKQFPKASIFTPLIIKELGAYFSEYLRKPDIASKIDGFHARLP